MYYSISSSPNPVLSNLRFPGLVLALAILLAGCNVEADTAPIINGPVCEISDLSQGWATCKQGQVLAFLPPTWGNEQLPIMAAALYCDFHHPIVHTNGGVTCVYTGTRKPVEVAREEKPKAAK
jgi:hypothetical protein